MARRFLRLEVSSLDHPVFKNPGTWQLWSGLMMMTKKKERSSNSHQQKIDWNGMDRTLQRDQITINYRDLAEKLGAPRNTIHRRMKKLVGWGLVKLERGPSFTVVTLGKYADKQPTWDSGGTQVGQERDASGTQAGHPKRILESEKGRSVEEFAQFWKAYPRKVSKPDALKACTRQKPDLESALTGLAGWVASWTDPQYIPYPATFLSRRQWEDPPKVEVTREETKQGERTPEELEALLKRRGVPGV